ncbi:MAG: ABC transporter permease [Oceanospirillaceae bacterium]
MDTISSFFESLQLLSLTPPGWGGNLLRGLLHSLEIALGGYSFGLVIGVLGACGKLYAGAFVRDTLACYTTLVRAVPELILILLFYYAGTDLLNQFMHLIGRDPVDVDGLVAGIFVIGLVQGAYATEVIRGAILAVPKGQLEAARAYGFSFWQTMRSITLPAMLPYAIPGLANLWLIATKDTALLAVVGFSELTLETKQAAGSTKHYMLFYCAAGMLYLMVTLISNQLIQRIEAWSRRGFAERGAS